MDYISQKIKSLPTIEATPELHRRIMNNAFYFHFRLPILVLGTTVALRAAIDIWHLANMGLTKAILAFYFDYNTGQVTLVEIIKSLSAKILRHPDIFLSFIINGALGLFVLYAMFFLASGKKVHIPLRQWRIINPAFIWSSIRNLADAPRTLIRQLIH